MANTPSNQLLDSLPAHDRNRLWPFLTPITLRVKQVLYKQDGPIEHVYFPCGGAVSFVRTMEDGGIAEAYTVGNEGIVGLSLAFGNRVSHLEVFVQVGGFPAYKMPAPVFMREIEARGAVYDRVMRYQEAVTIHLQQTAACNALHQAEQRCCRWLLATRDRVGTDDLKLTHEFLAIMLGVRRPTVTVILGALERAGLVESPHRGTITITNYDKLVQASCECYSTVKAHFSRLLASSNQQPTA